MRCPHCPVPIAEVCRGIDVPHLCHLVGPANPDRRPEYERILVCDDVQVTDAMRATWAANANFDPDFVTVGGCGC